MIKPEFGRKCVCVSCAARFYDMTRVPAICPKCSTAQPPPKARAFSPPRGALRGRQPVPMAPLPAEADAEAVVEVEEEEEEVDEIDEDAADAEEQVAEEV